MSDDATSLGELGRLFGRLEHAFETALIDVRNELADHSTRIHALEEKEIRADEREKTRQDFWTDITLHEDTKRNKGQFTVQKWQAVLAAAAVVAMFVAPFIANAT